MNLLNTIALPNQLVAHGKEYLAVYSNGVVKTYRKNSITNDLTLMPITYAVVGVLAMRMSIDGSIVAVQTDSQTIRLQNGTQTVFDNVGKFDIANTGHLIIVDPVNGAVQVITQSTTNITASVTPDDRVAVGRQGYIVYNTARTLTAAKFADVVFTNTASAKEIVFAMHVKDDKYALFFKDGTASYDGVTRTVAGPFMGWREFGSHVLSTDYKQDYYVSRFNPITDSKILRPFKWDLPPALNNDYSSMLLMVPGSGFTSADFDLKNALAVASSTAVTSVADSPYGPTGKSLKFNGTTSILQTADSANIQLGANDFTIELFLKVENADVSSLAFHKGADGTAVPSYGLTVTSNKSFNFNVSTNGTAYAFTLLDVGKFELGVWTHVAITRKGDKYRFFQDGKMRGSFTLAGALFAHTGKGIQFGHYRAGNYTTGTPTSLLNGSINGFQILNYAKYLHDFYVEALSTTPSSPPFPATGTLLVERVLPSYTGSFSTAQYMAGSSRALLPSPDSMQILEQNVSVTTIAKPAEASPYAAFSMVADSFVAVSAVGTKGYLSINGGTSFAEIAPANTYNTGLILKFKGYIWMLYAASVRRYNLGMTSFATLTRSGGTNLMQSECWDYNANCIISTTNQTANAANLYVSWDGPDSLNAYPMDLNTNLRITYVGNNVFYVRTLAATGISKLIWVPPTSGVPILLADLPKVYDAITLLGKTIVVRLGDALSLVGTGAVENPSATRAQAQLFANAIATAEGQNPLVCITAANNRWVTPWKAQKRLIVGAGAGYQVWQF